MKRLAPWTSGGIVLVAVLDVVVVVVVVLVGCFCGGGCNSVGFSNQIKSNQIKGFYCKST